MHLWSFGPRPHRAESVLCTHCGLPTPGAEDTGSPVFCCRACRQIYELMLALAAPDPV